MKNNKGFSLMELLIVVVIAAIMVGFVTITMAIVTNADASKAANAFDTAINTSRIQCMAKGTDAGQLILSSQDGFLYYQIGLDGPLEKICTPAISVNVITNSSVSEGDAMPDGDIGVISFNSAGMVKNINSDTIIGMRFSRGNRTMETVLYPETGKHFVYLVQ